VQTTTVRVNQLT